MSINNCKDFIRESRQSPQNFFLVHYSCQSLYDDNDALSPRITSIAITHLSTEQTVSFSTHSIAEEMHISREFVRERFDEIESKLLSEFYTFLRDRRDKYWVHWNMRNLTFGFEHLEHRYRVLGHTDGAIIPVERRLNLNDLLADRFGKSYASHPKMRALMELNGGIHRHFLSGQEEVEAFKNNEFIRMHNSTLSKTGFFHAAISLLISGKLKTASHGIGVTVDRMFESRLAKMVGLVSGSLGIVVVIWQGIAAFW